jgi:hypothetical protein
MFKYFDGINKVLNDPDVILNHRSEMGSTTFKIFIFLIFNPVYLSNLVEENLITEISYKKIRICYLYYSFGEIYEGFGNNDLYKKSLEYLSKNEIIENKELEELIKEIPPKVILEAIVDSETISRGLFKHFLHMFERILHNGMVSIFYEFFFQ